MDATNNSKHGAVVKLPDGTIGTLVWSGYGEAHVVHEDVALGRGPWIYRVAQLTPVTPDELAAYDARIAARE